MLKLFKYELRKSSLSKLIILGLTLLVEAFFIYSIIKVDAGKAAIAVVLLMLCGVIGIAFAGILSVTTLHRDMNTKQSYMLFMTPNSKYAILGAKALEAVLSILVSFLFFSALAYIDVRLILDKFGNVKELVDTAKYFTSCIDPNLDLNVASIAGFAIYMVSLWIEIIMTAFFADVIVTSILKGKKFGMLLTAVLFIALNSCFSQVTSLVPTMDSFLVHQVVSAIIYLVISAGLCYGTATIMEKKLSV